jgi:hypothetical protein
MNVSGGMSTGESMMDRLQGGSRGGNGGGGGRSRSCKLVGEARTK